MEDLEQQRGHKILGDLVSPYSHNRTGCDHQSRAHCPPCIQVRCCITRLPGV